ncbi:MAG: HAD-IA family hydrolase [Alphaproteobacteria bacterium]|nr:HAD-IA family hydrolase [Alphaproteobacteria bacterium]
MTIKKYSMTLSGHKTSISLEPEFWNQLKTIAKKDNLSIQQLIAVLDKGPRYSGLSSCIRIFILDRLLKENDFLKMGCKMKNIKNVIFDFGGVIVDWNPRYLFKKIFNNDGEMEYFLNNICTQEWNASLDKSDDFKNAISKLKKEHPKYSKYIDLYDSEWLKMIGSFNDKTLEIEQKLCKKFNVYGLTNWNAEKFKLTYNELEKFKLFVDSMKGVVVSGIEHEIKPDDKLFKILLKRYNLVPEETLFIDDSIANIETAKKLGLNTLNFKSSEQLETDLSLLNIKL